ncbi:MAG: hypothetical protein HYY67_04810 [Thaumarchaeota archaeon]|nr:hypothetical protein [Nitrososphaerota archaeon]
MYLKDANILLRRAIISAYFEPELLKLGYKHSNIKHQNLGKGGISKNDLLHLFFDFETGSEYPDGDEWFIAEYLIPYNITLPDTLKSPDYFATLPLGGGIHHWRHRELIRYRSGKMKKLDGAMNFIDQKYSELLKTLQENSVSKNVRTSGKKKN